ncbi:MAG: HNH endonuclease signature motif containing protein [Pseudomonadota bacterium]
MANLIYPIKDIASSRKEAKATGKKYYFTGIPCKHNHLSKRRISNTCCIGCSKQYYQTNAKKLRHYNEQWRIDNRDHVRQWNAQWRENNPESVKQHQHRWLKISTEHRKQYNKQWYEENIEVVLQRSKQWRDDNLNKVKQYREDNAEQFRQYAKQYRKDNPDKVALWRETRLRQIIDATPPWYEEELVRNVYLKRDELNALGGTRFEVDHIVPIINDKVCGLHCLANLQILTKSDNGSKNNNHTP